MSVSAFQPLGELSGAGGECKLDGGDEDGDGHGDYDDDDGDNSPHLVHLPLLQATFPPAQVH